MSKKINIENVGPIERLEIPIPESGGVVLLQGRNGSGKSHAIDAASAITGDDDARKGLTANDRQESDGTVEGLGVSIDVGKRNKTSGTLEVRKISGTLDPSKFVDPGIKDPLRADAARLSILVKLAGLEVAGSSWMQMAGDDTALADQIRELDLVDHKPIETAGQVRRLLQSIAREIEKDAGKMAEESAGYAAAIKGVDLEEPSDSATLTAAFEDATTELANAKNARETWLEHEDIAKDARGQLEKLGDDCKLEFWSNKLADCDKAIGDLDQEIEDLEEKLEASKERKRKTESARNSAQVEAERAHTKAEDRKRAQNAINAFELLDEVTPEDLEKLDAAKDQARQAMDRGAVIRDAKAKSQLIFQLQADRTEAEQKAEAMRELATGVDQVLVDALTEAGVDQVKVKGDRLVVESARSDSELFCELSHGQRWKLALEIAAANLPAGSVLPVCQEAWESLDPDNRSAIDQTCKTTGLVIITAEATDGELRADQFGGAQ